MSVAAWGATTVRRLVVALCAIWLVWPASASADALGTLQETATSTVDTATQAITPTAQPAAPAQPAVPAAKPAVPAAKPAAPAAKPAAPTTPAVPATPAAPPAPAVKTGAASPSSPAAPSAPKAPAVPVPAPVQQVATAPVQQVATEVEETVQAAVPGEPPEAPGSAALAQTVDQTVQGARAVLAPATEASRDAAAATERRLAPIATGTAAGLSGAAAEGVSDALEGLSGAAAGGVSGTGLEGLSAGTLQALSGTVREGLSGGALEGLSGTVIEGLSGGSLESLSGSVIEGLSPAALQGLSSTALSGASQLAGALLSGTPLVGPQAETSLAKLTRGIAQLSDTAGRSLAQLVPALPGPLAPGHAPAGPPAGAPGPAAPPSLPLPSTGLRSSSTLFQRPNHGVLAAVHTHSGSTNAGQTALHGVSSASVTVPPAAVETQVDRLRAGPTAPGSSLPQLPAPASGSNAGGGFGLSIFIAVLLGALVLLARGALRNLRHAPDFLRPAPFISALERPG